MSGINNSERPQESAATVIIGSFDVTKQLPNGGSISLHGYIYNQDEANALNIRIDQFADAANRQFIRAGIELREAQREQQIENLKKIREILAANVDKRNGGAKLTSVEKQQIDQAERSIAASLEQIKQIEAGIAQAKAQVGMVAG